MVAKLLETGLDELSIPTVLIRRAFETFEGSEYIARKATSVIYLDSIVDDLVKYDFPFSYTEIETRFC